MGMYVYSLLLHCLDPTGTVNRVHRKYWNTRFRTQVDWEWCTVSYI